MKNTFLSSVFAAVLLILCGNAAVNAQSLVVNYDFASTTSTTTTNAACVTSTTPLTVNTGVTSTFSTSTGTCSTPAGNASTVPPAFAANASNQAVSIAGFATGATNYFQFQLSGVSGYQNYMLYFQAARSGTGPTDAAVQYSTDGTNFTTFTTVNPPATANPLVLGSYNVDLSTITALNGQPTIYFRIVGSGGTNPSGTLRIDNFQVSARLTPTAASVSVAGRILTSNRRGLSGARVYLTDQYGESKVAVTGAFGFYRFEDVEVGGTYTLSVLSKRYEFQPRVVTVTEETENFNFAPLP